MAAKGSGLGNSTVLVAIGDAVLGGTWKRAEREALYIQEVAQVKGD